MDNDIILSMLILIRTILIITSLSLLSACHTNPSMNEGEVISTQAWHEATDQAVEKYAPSAERSLKPYFQQANLAYPPQNVAMLAFKQEKKMELWASSGAKGWHHIRDYPLTAFSGRLGPKLQRNDGQIPEGIYHITRFNPYSSQHLSMMLNYPNAFDRFYAKRDGRVDLGDNIFIHGKAKSVGCLAVGNKAIDELFVLVREVGKGNTKVIIAPHDFRKGLRGYSRAALPHWVPSLYQRISNELKAFQEA